MIIPQIVYPRGTEINETALAKLIAAFKGGLQAERIKLDKYARADQPLDKNVPPNRPDNRVITNYCRYITTVQTGYFIGKAVTYSWPEGVADIIDPILMLSDEDEENLALATDMSKYGVAYELVYTEDDADGEKQIRFDRADPLMTCMIYDDTIRHEPLAGIRLWQTLDADGNAIERGTLYEITRQRDFSTAEGKLVFAEPIANPYGMLPLIEYRNNPDMIGDYAQVLSLQDGYNVALSSTLDDLQKIANSLLVIKNMGGTDEEDIKEINKTGVAQINEDGDMYWLSKALNVEAIREILLTLRQNALFVSMTPDLMDQSFGGQQSGVAMLFKMWGIDQSRTSKEQMFKKGLNHRYALIGKYLVATGQQVNLDYTATFYRNLPQDVASIVTWLTQLYGKVSMKTFLSQLPFVDDPSAELSAMVSEEQQLAGAGGADLTEIQRLLQEAGSAAELT